MRLAPHLVGMGAGKSAVVLSLVSLDDANGNRYRIHTCLHGPPGSGKSSLIQAAADVVGVELFSPRLTTSSVTLDMRSGTLGILADSTGNRFKVFAADELEKVDPRVLRFFLGAFEQGRFTTARRGKPLTIRAPWRFLASVNDLDALAPELRSRFDFRVRTPLPSLRVGERVLDGIADQFAAGRSGVRADPLWFRQYLEWARRFVPGPAEGREQGRIRLVLRAVLRAYGDASDLRRYGSILRTAGAIARIRRQPMTAASAMEASETVFPELDLGPTFKPLKRLWGSAPGLD